MFRETRALIARELIKWLERDIAHIEREISQLERLRAEKLLELDVACADAEEACGFAFIRPAAPRVVRIVPEQPDNVVSIRGQE